MGAAEKAAMTRETAALIEREKIRLAFGSWSRMVEGAPMAVLVTLLMGGLAPALGSAHPVASLTFLISALGWSEIGRAHV